MRALVQRVTGATVSVNTEVVGTTGPGLMILVCAMAGDGPDTARALADKILKLRIFRDDGGKTNRSLTEIAELLGFTAPSSFSRWYLTQFGCSAKESRAKGAERGSGN